MLNEVKKQEILVSAKQWFKEKIARNHIKNTEKLTDPREFNINPFLVVYLANYLGGDSSPRNLAKALIIPRVLGTSITTSFGQNLQSFLDILEESFGSTTSGIDIEFIDQIDGRKKYCQLKAGPNTINKDDVETIAGHLRSVRNLGRTNNVKIDHDDLIVGVLYGEEKDLSSHYRRITSDYDFPVKVGEDLWHRLTGDPDFYWDLINALSSVAIESDYSGELNRVIDDLAKHEEISKLSEHIINNHV